LLFQKYKTLYYSYRYNLKKNNLNPASNHPVSLINVKHNQLYSHITLAAKKPSCSACCDQSFIHDTWIIHSYEDQNAFSRPLPVKVPGVYFIRPLYLNFSIWFMADVHIQWTVYEWMHCLLSELWLGFVMYFTASISAEVVKINVRSPTVPSCGCLLSTTVNMCTRHTEWPINRGRCGISVLPLPKKTCWVNYNNCNGQIRRPLLRTNPKFQ